MENGEIRVFHVLATAARKRRFSLAGHKFAGFHVNFVGSRSVLHHLHQGRPVVSPKEVNGEVWRYLDQ